MTGPGRRRSFRAALAHLAAFATVVAALATPTGLRAEISPGINGHDPESQLVKALQEIQASRLESALAEVDRLLAKNPNFRLAHLIKGDLLLARARPISGLGNTGHAAPERIDELRAEAVARLRAKRERPEPDRVPRYLLQLDPGQRYAIVVDSKRSRLYLYDNANGTPRLVTDFYTTLGKRGIEKAREGDQKTPIGVYHVTSNIPGSKLPDLYGAGAFPISYPNEWDRMLGRNGYGIWLHGVPKDTYNRAPWASDGCIALANPDLVELGKSVQVGLTPVVIADEVQWVTPDELRAERDALRRQFDAWRADWESRDTGRYLLHYAKGFRSGAMDLAAWSEHKHRVNAGKAWIKVGLSNVSMFRSPGGSDLVVITFTQDYRSNNLAQQSRKRQYWIREGESWKIAYEAEMKVAGSVALPESFPRGRR